MNAIKTYFTGVAKHIVQLLDQENKRCKLAPERGVAYEREREMERVCVCVCEMGGGGWTGSHEGL